MRLNWPRKTKNMSSADGTSARFRYSEAHYPSTDYFPDNNDANNQANSPALPVAPPLPTPKLIPSKPGHRQCRRVRRYEFHCGSRVFGAGIRIDAPQARPEILIAQVMSEQAVYRDPQIAARAAMKKIWCENGKVVEISLGINRPSEMRNVGGFVRKMGDAKVGVNFVKGTV